MVLVTVRRTCRQCCSGPCQCFWQQTEITVPTLLCSTRSPVSIPLYRRQIWGPHKEILSWRKDLCTRPPMGQILSSQHQHSNTSSVLRAKDRSQSTESVESGGSIWIVVGLGNPGREYEGNRHNASLHSFINDALWRECNFASGDFACFLLSLCLHYLRES